jgi:predicted CoA-substrate-specific enzyme activase
VEKTKKGFLGVDSGSVGIKLALMDEEENLVKGIYLRNNGIAETLGKGLEDIATEEYKIGCVGVTGSGRTFTSALIGADSVKTEILAHTIGTLHYYPNVRTIMDIGGEDCKIISIKEGVLENFVMNSICGAGTGAVIDSIANRLGIKIDEVGDLALNYKETLDFPGKCGVFTQSSVVSKLNSGCDKSDILMGVIRALVNNYLMLGKGISLKPPFVYQGATSKNKAIVEILEEQLDAKVIVPEYASIMGAIGIALYTKRCNSYKTNFRGYDISNKDIKFKTTKTKGCENMCELNLIYEYGELIGCVGNRCDKCIPKKIRLN